MPRPGPRRSQVAFRLDAETLAAIDHLADVEGVDRSEMIRRLIHAALTTRKEEQ